MAHKKAAGSTALGRDSQAKRLGVKLFAGEFAHAGSIVVRQRGTKIRPGKNVGIGSDDTLFAKQSGVVVYRSIKKRRFEGSRRPATYVDIHPKISD